MRTDSRNGAHTPGPWRKAGGYVHGPDCIVCKVGAYEDAELARQSKARWEADSRLIAAAPALLALLKELIDIEGPQPGTNEWARKVRAAIANAEGRA